MASMPKQVFWDVVWANFLRCVQPEWTKCIMSIKMTKAMAFPTVRTFSLAFVIGVQNVGPVHVAQHAHTLSWRGGHPEEGHAPTLENHKISQP